MEAEARRILTAVRRHQQLRADTGIRYPADLRARVLAHAAVMEHSGESVKSIAGRLGVRPRMSARSLASLSAATARGLNPSLS